MWLEPDRAGLGLLAGVVDRGVAVGVQQQEVARPHQGGDHPEIGLVAGREDHGVAHAVEVGELALQGDVVRERAVGDPRAAGAGALAPDRRDRRLDAGLVEGQAQIVVRAGRDDPAAVDDRLAGRQQPLHHHAGRHAARGARGLVAGGQAGVGVEDAQGRAS